MTRGIRPRTSYSAYLVSSHPVCGLHRVESAHLKTPENGCA